MSKAIVNVIAGSWVKKWRMWSGAWFAYRLIFTHKHPPLAVVCQVDFNSITGACSKHTKNQHKSMKSNALLTYHFFRTFPDNLVFISAAKGSK